MARNVFLCNPARWNGVYLISRKMSCLPLSTPELNLDYLCDPKNSNDIRENIRRRAGIGDVDKLVDLGERIKFANNARDKERLKNEILEEALKFPNTTHPVSWNTIKPKIRDIFGEKRSFSFPVKQLQDIASCKGLIRQSHLGKITGPRTYYLKGALADLEQALIHFTIDKLMQKNFVLMSVPDVIHPSIIKSCGMETEGTRTQVYALNSSQGPLCLAGTAEMSVAGLYANEILPVELLPQKVAAVSRCYRAEVSNIADEKGIFRVHQFTKVEMFAVTTNENKDDSDKILSEFVSIQRELFSSLGLHFQILEMPPIELGTPAHRKIDIEAWMPGRNVYGEISSASNCTAYQSRRLGIKYKRKTGEKVHCHTVNGTACAVPRMLIAILESNQEKDGSVKIPNALWTYMNDKKEIGVENIPELKWIRLKSN